MRRQSWMSAAAVYLDRRIVTVLLLGFSSGLPFALTGATLAIRLASAGVSRTAIGLFALVALPYTIKFAWAPLVDRLPIPVLTRSLGRRRAWAIVSQVALIGALLLLGATEPTTAPWSTALAALVVAFCSATQDIVIDAYRVEILDEDQYGAGAAVVVLGYRIGLLASGAGALYLADRADWSTVYALMAGLVVVGMVAVLAAGEPAALPSVASVEIERRGRAKLERWAGLGGRSAAIAVWLYGAVIAPCAEFMTRRAWAAVLLFVAIYKLGDVLAGVMAGPFYLDLGFTKTEIAAVTKVFGLIALIIGGFLGGVLVSRVGVARSLLVSAFLQMGSILTLVLLAVRGHDIVALTVAIGAESVAQGMGTAAFVAYLSSLCSVAYTATQYALLSSFAAFGRDLLAAPGGWLADHMSWLSYFLLCAGAALPGIFLLLWLSSRPGGLARGTHAPAAATQ